MKNIYFVTEGPTDLIVLEGLISKWLGDEDFIARQIQPPSSDYAKDLDTNLSEGWKGVLSWCEGSRPNGPAGRDTALSLADCIIIHTDADVAIDADFKSPPFNGPCPPASNSANWVRNHLSSKLGANALPKVVLCVPAQDLESWVLCSLHPTIADNHIPIECRLSPGSLLVQRKPHKLVRSKGGSLKKITSRYRRSLTSIVDGWPNCASGVSPRCPEATRFEVEAKLALGV